MTNLLAFAPISDVFSGFLNPAYISASTSDDDGGSGIAYLFLLSGIIFYVIMYLRYRNTDKRHMHETETSAVTLNMKKADELVKRRKGLKNARMQGANDREVRGALAGGDWAAGMAGFATGVGKSQLNKIPGMGKILDPDGGAPPGAVPGQSGIAGFAGPMDGSGSAGFDPYNPNNPNNQGGKKKK